MILREFRLNDLYNNSHFKAMDKQAQFILANSLRHYTGNAWTLEHEGEIIGSAGFIQPYPGVANGWAVTSELIYKYPLATHKAMVKMLGTLEKKHGLRRIQAECLKGFGKAVKWLMHLGFEFEGEMKRAGPNGETMLRFARTR